MLSALTYQLRVNCSGLEEKRRIGGAEHVECVKRGGVAGCALSKHCEYLLEERGMRHCESHGMSPEPLGGRELHSVSATTLRDEGLSLREHELRCCRLLRHGRC